jgi:hypothetical protein
MDNPAARDRNALANLPQPTWQNPRPARSGPTAQEMDDNALQPPRPVAQTMAADAPAQATTYRPAADHFVPGLSDMPQVRPGSEDLTAMSRSTIPTIRDAVWKPAAECRRPARRCRSAPWGAPSWPTCSTSNQSCVQPPAETTGGGGAEGASRRRRQRRDDQARNNFGAGESFIDSLVSKVASLADPSDLSRSNNRLIDRLFKPADLLIRLWADWRLNRSRRRGRSHPQKARASSANLRSATPLR